MSIEVDGNTIFTETFEGYEKSYKSKINFQVSKKNNKYFALGAAMFGCKL